MRKIILPTLAFAFGAPLLLLACSNTSTETARNANGNINSSRTNATINANVANTSGANNANAINAAPNEANSATTNAVSGAAQTPAKISIEEARALVDGGKAVFVDVRGTNDYNTAHIKGAIDMSVSDIPTRYAQLPKNKKIITYCT